MASLDKNCQNRIAILQILLSFLLFTQEDNLDVLPFGFELLGSPNLMVPL